MTAYSVRNSSSKDIPAVQTLCALLEPNGYIPDAWAIWLKDTRSINLVVDWDSKIVGCLHGELITSQEAWSQAMRIHPEYQRSGIASQLLTTIHNMLKQRGVSVVRGSIHTSNHPSRVFFKKLGWTEFARISRRSAQGGSFDLDRSPGTTLSDVISLWNTYPMLASCPHIGRFRRIYFTLTEEYLTELFQGGRVRVSSDNQAYALLDPVNPLTADVMWVSGISGSLEGKETILRELIQEAKRQYQRLIVDGSDEPDIQTVFGAMGFEPPDEDGTFIIVEKWL